MSCIIIIIIFGKLFLVLQACSDSTTRNKNKTNPSMVPALRTCTKADSLLRWFLHPCCHIFLMRVKTCCTMFFSVIRGYLILSIMFFQALFVGCMRKWNACSSRHFIPFCKTPTPAGIPCFWNTLHFLPFNTHRVFNEYYEKQKLMQILTLGKALNRALPKYNSQATLPCVSG